MNGEKNKAKIGIIGVGGRGTSLLKTSLEMNDVEILAISDLNERNLDQALELVEETGRERPAGYYNYHDLLSREDIEGVIIATDWTAHGPIAIDVMKAGKYAAPEVWGATSLEECWNLVRVSEETKKPCMMLENVCYSQDFMAALNIVRQGLFGELIHCEGGYQHDLRPRLVKGKETSLKKVGPDDFRTIHNKKRNGDIYPTHGLGPIAKCLNINTGNRFISLTSTASKARGLKKWVINNLDQSDPAYDENWAIGDVITTTIRCQNGETVTLKHITTLPCPYSLLGRVQGTKGLWVYDNNSIYIEGQSPEHKWESFDAYRDKYEHPLWKEYLAKGIRGGHGGADYLTLRAFFDSVRYQLETPIDVYDTAAWIAITVLSEQSIALGSNSVIFPDFTSGQWMFRESNFAKEERIIRYLSEA